MSFHLKLLVTVNIVSSLLMTLLTPLIANGQTIDEKTTDIEAEAVANVAQR